MIETERPISKNIIRSIYESQETPIECRVTGKIPKWLNGSLLRNGAGRFRFGENVYKHMFDGMACINKFQIKDGKVFYSNKLLETNIMKKNLNSDKLETQFGTNDPCSSLFERFKAFFETERRSKNDNNNVNIVPFGNNQVYALTESPVIMRLDPNTFEIINSYNLSKYIAPTVSTIAHPHIEDDGSWLSVGMSPGKRGMQYDIMRFKFSDVDNACVNATSIAKIPSSHLLGSSYFHSFSITENYIVFLEQSIIVDLKYIVWNLIVNKPIVDSLVMDKNFNTKIHLIDRKTGQKVEKNYYTDPQFTFHTINAFESHSSDLKKNELFIDVCSLDVEKLKIGELSYDDESEENLSKFFFDFKPLARRITVPLNTQQDEINDVYCEIKDIVENVAFDLSTINYSKYNAKPYNYAYGLGAINPPLSVVKINVNKINDYKIASIEKNKNKIFLPSEPIFVSNPDGTEEDDGVVLTALIGDYNDVLVILDAKTMVEIGRAELPVNVKSTFTFHGFFADTKNFKF